MNNINIGSVRRQGVITFDNGVKLKTEFYLTPKNGLPFLTMKNAL